MKEIKTNPTAKVSLKKNVLKVYNVDGKDVVYLPKNAEFEIELFNPTSGRVLAKIELNNKVISRSGIVLKPGERIFLERYLDDNKKFMFETYEVDSSIENIESIIANNGLVTVSFYEEINNPFWTTTAWYDLTPRYYCAQPSTVIYGTCGQNATVTLTSSCSGDVVATNANTTAYVAPASFNGTLSSNTAERSINPCGEVFCSTIETGLIGKGEVSDQEFKNVNYNFSSYCFSKVTVKILPDSQKLISSEDLKRRKYCSECGSKVKETDKYCSNCGTKL